jgi:two-component system cell cycle sensor histidine kinase/response regulator CckA
MGTAPLRSMPRDQELRFHAMFEGAAIGIGTCTLDGHILESNPALAKMLGYTRKELAGMHLRDLRPSDFQQENDPLEELQRGMQDSIKQENRYRRKDGACLWGQLTMSMARDAGSDTPFLIAILEDITERRHASEKSRENEKMEVIGRLAGGIAHDFNNLLTGVLLYCDLLSAGIEPGSQMLQHVDEIRLAGEHGAALTQQLLAIARKQGPQQPSPIQLNNIVASTENLLRRLIGEQIELVTVLAPRLRTVLADQAQLRQVLMNLVLNARDAMPQGGRITVRTLSHRSRSGAPPTVSLLVEDTGCGMDEPTRARLFEPFFTTKPPGHGTGLGLATVQRIVLEARGMIDVKSEPGHGTRIEVSLPALDVVPAVSQRQKRSQTGETILLVDDHASARNSIQRILQHAGYHVLPASCAKRALKIFAEAPNGIDLLIADWMMPDINGRDLAEKLHRQKPGLKVLLISGYHDRRDGPPAASLNLIRKPFAGGVLLERIRELFDSKGDLTW